MATGAAGEEQEHCGDPAIELVVLDQAELVEDRAGVLFHPGDADLERAGDRSIGAAGRELCENLVLAGRERSERRFHQAHPGAQEHVDDLVVDERTTGGDRMHRSEEVLRVVDPVFEDVAAPSRAGTEHRDDVLGLGELRHDDDADVGPLVA